MDPSSEVLSIPTDKKGLMRYLRVLHRFFAEIPSDKFDAVFMLWCVRLVKVLTIDDNIEIVDHNLLNAIINATNDILYLSKANTLFDDAYMKGLEEILKKTCSSQKNGILIEEILNEFHMHKCEYDRVRLDFICKIKGELIKKAWHPMRILKHMELYNVNPADM